MALVVAGASTFAQVPEAADMLRREGHEARYVPLGATASESEVAASLDGASAVIAGAEPYTSLVFDQLRTLRHVSRVGVGFDGVNVAAATAHGIVVSVTPGTNDWAVADHGFGLMLALAHNIGISDRAVRAGSWLRPIGVDLWKKTLGLVGLGRIGRGMVVRARGFDMRVIAHEPSPDLDFVKQYNVELVTLEELLAQSDFVSLHLPSTAETHQLINRGRLGLMKPTAFLINTARGQLVDEGALVEALKAGTIAGAGLDVREHEPPRPSDLERLPNVVLTAHIAGFTTEAIRAMVLMACQNVIDVLAGRMPAGCVNPAVFEWQPHGQGGM